MKTSLLRGSFALCALLLMLAHAGAADQKTGTDTDGDTYTIKLTSVGMLQVDPAGGSGPIVAITVVGGDAKSALSVTVKLAAAGSADGKVSIGQITSSGSVGSIVAPKSDLVGTGITLAGGASKITLANISAGADITLGADPAIKALAVTAGNVGAIDLTSPAAAFNFTALGVTGGAVFNVGSVGTFKTTAGPLAADITASGRIGAVSVTGGNFSGNLTTPASLGTFKVVKDKAGVGGAILASKFSASAIGTISTARALSADIEALGKIVAVLVTGGDLTGHIAAGDSIGGISVKKDKAGVGGSIIDSFITAKNLIGALLLDGDLVDSYIMSGADFGGDLEPGGTGANADRYGPGALRSVKIGGQVSGSILGAGFTPVDGAFGDLNDGAIGGKLSKLGSLTIKGQLLESLIGAGLFPAKVSVNRVSFKPLTDPRFISRRVVVPPPIRTAITPLDPLKAMPVASATTFLYTGKNPIQTGVAPGTILPERAAILRGRVLTRDNAPLAGVQVTILGQPVFGETFTREDGMFDLAVNGGGKLVVVLEASGFSTVQRQLDTTVQDFQMLGDVVLVTADAMMTQVALGAGTPMQMHEASVQTDDSGSRHAALMFPPATNASLLLPDGTSLAMNSLRVRATEFTVGPNGPAAMPAVLPPNSGYTYCVDLTADEAINAGATTVSFSQPVYFYLENFLGFNVGLDVPSGFYDKVKGRWEAGPSGRVIKIVSIAGGAAALDVDGDGSADSGPALSALGITDAERAQLAARYAAGQSLWRVPIAHFTPYDMNWPVYPPEGAEPPDTTPKSDDPPDDPDDPPNVFIQSQSAGETVALAGVPFALNYRSERMPGRTASRGLQIPLSTAALPPGVQRIALEVSVAGHSFKQEFAPGFGLSTNFMWDGRDAYDRPVAGRQAASVRVGYVYDASYAPAPRFGSNGTAGSIGIDRARGEITLSTMRQAFLGGTDFRQQGVAGWTFEVHHTYDPSGRKLYLGDGRSRSVESVGAVVQSVAGTGEPLATPAIVGIAPAAVVAPTPTPALEEKYETPYGVAVAADGSVVFSDVYQSNVFLVTLDGLVRRFAGNGDFSFSGDGGPAEDAALNQPKGVAMGRDGSVFIADFGNSRIRRVAPNGLISTFAGTDNAGYSGDGGPATTAQLRDPSGVSVGPDGTVYIADTGNHAIRAVGTDGTIRTVAGTGAAGFNGDDRLATTAQLSAPLSAAADLDGNVFIADTGNRTVRKVSADGMITRVAGVTGQQSPDFSPSNDDGGPALLALFRVPAHITIETTGEVIVGDPGAGRVRRLERGGLIVGIAGASNFEFNFGGPQGEKGPALQAPLGRLFTDFGGLNTALGPDGALFFADGTNHRVRTLVPPLPGFSGGDLAIPSDDGAQLFRFNASGRHLATVNALTGATLYTFTYDSAGRLVKVIDGSGNTTTVQRAAGGAPTAIVGPFGQKTALTAEASGMLTRIEAPTGTAHQFTYAAGGLLTAETDPLAQAHSFTYDAGGLLTKGDLAGLGVANIARTETAGGYFVTTTDALGAAEKYELSKPATGGEVRTNSDAAGVLTTDVRRADGAQKFTSRDGQSASVASAPDPRFGLQAGFDRAITATTPGGKSRTVQHEEQASLNVASNPLSLSSLTRTTQLNGILSSRSYDPAARTFQESTALGRQSSSVTDALGRLTSLTSPDTNPLALSYDAEGQIKTITTGSGAEARGSQLTYQKGYPATFRDALGKTENYARNAFGSVTERTRADGSKAQFGYDALQRLTSLTVPGGATHTFTHTPEGRLATYTAPGGLVTALTYDAAHQLTQIAYPGGSAVTFTRDAIGHVTSRNDGAAATTFNFDATTGKLTTATAPGGVVLALSYDGALLTGASWSGPVTGAVTRTVDDFFRLASYRINGGDPIAFTYDSDGDVTAAGDLGLVHDASRGWVTSTGLGVVSDTRGYNGFGEQTSYVAAANGATVFSTQTSYDKLGRGTRSVETVGGGTAQTFDYAYDVLDRLREVKKDGVIAESFTYDANGNRLTVTGVPTTANALDQLTALGGATFSYSPRGDRLARSGGALPAASYSYDGRGILTGVNTAGTTVTYLHDPLQRRIGKSVGGTRTRGFLYDGAFRVLAQLDGANAVVCIFVYADRSNVPSYLIRGGQAYRLIADKRGSVRFVVNAATGVVAQRLDYGAFGDVLLDTNPGFQPFGFAGGLYDPDTGLTRFGTRDYDAATGVWLQKDAELFGGRQFNLYAYVAGDPINRVDLGGENFVDVGTYTNGTGHSTISVDGDGFRGFYPGEGQTFLNPVANDTGTIRPDGGDGNAPNSVTRFEITPDQARRIREFIESQRGKRRYNLITSNCTDFVLEALQKADVLPRSPVEKLIPGLRIPRVGFDTPASVDFEMREYAKQGMATQVR